MVELVVKTTTSLVLKVEHFDAIPQWKKDIDTVLSDNFYLAAI
jgi:hypothetical protein